MRHRLASFCGDLAGLLLWVLEARDPRSMTVVGVAFANPETQREKVLVDDVGVHGILGNGARTHGAPSAELQRADQERHTKAGGLHRLLCRLDRSLSSEASSPLTEKGRGEVSS